MNDEWWMTNDWINTWCQTPGSWAWNEWEGWGWGWEWGWGWGRGS